MYIFHCDDGTYCAAPESFSPEVPDFTLLEHVDEVLCISKVYVKQMKLVVKPKDEIQQIRSQQEAGNFPARKRGRRPKEQRNED